MRGHHRGAGGGKRREGAAVPGCPLRRRPRERGGGSFPASLGVAAGLSEGHGESCGAGGGSGVGQESGAGSETVVPGVTRAPVPVPLPRRRSRVCGAASRSGLHRSPCRPGREQDEECAAGSNLHKSDLRDYSEMVDIDLLPGVSKVRF